MKVIIHNPHAETHFSKIVYYFFTGRFSHAKYDYLLHYLLDRKDIELILFFDGNDSSFFFKFPLRIEVYLWFCINRINPLRAKIVYSLDSVDADIFFSFSFRNLDRDKSSSIKDILRDRNELKVFHLTHYMYSTEKIAESVESVGVDVLVAENNLMKNSNFFRKHFSSYAGNFYCLPFVPKSRFKKIKKFEDRKNKCLATGTFHVLKKNWQTKTMIEYFKVDSIHPLRKEIFEKKEDLCDVLDSYVSNFVEREKKNSHKGSFLKRMYLKYYNLFKVKQKDYFKFNIVEKYNEYKMFVVPEEISDLPGIGFVEGMACGSVFFGKNDPMYEDLGMKDGKHYVAYNGSLDDLREKIKYYQSHEKELIEIGENGYQFVIDNFGGNRVAGRFVDYLSSCTKHRK